MESFAGARMQVPPAAAAGARRLRAGSLALAAWLAVLAASWAWGSALNDSGANILLASPPLFGEPDLRIDPWVLAPVAAAVLIVALAPGIARTAPWRGLLAAAFGGALAWSVALALTGGPGALAAPLEGPNEYLSAVPLVGSAGEFLATFTERLDGYPTHVRGHPPGMVLALLGLDSLGLHGTWPAALTILLVAASAPVAALIALRAVADEGQARRAAPYLVLVPGAVWIATSADGLYMGVGAWAVALTVLAITGAGRRSDLLALGGGVAFGATLFLSYGLVLLGAIPLGVGLARRRLRPLLLAGVGVAAVVVTFAAAGFWWLDGLFEVREQYAASVQRSRPYDFFILNNLAAFGLAAGPAAAIALGLLRDRRAWLLVGGGLTAVALADLSGMSKAEVERIWLPFLPWVLLATAALPTLRWSGRALLAGQAAIGLAVQVGVRTVW